MKIVFSSLFRDDLRREIERYTEILPRLGEDFSARV